jgi:arabinan endo-1,5-alpha-L-arabinosidase
VVVVTKGTKKLAIAGVSLIGVLWASFIPCRAALTGQIGLHDPSTIVKDGSKYYVFATGQGITVRSSSNLSHWQTAPQVFGTAPAWTQQEVPANEGHLWAPDILKYGDEYRLYYSISSFGSQDSAIGLATNVTLDAASPNYQWVDRGLVIDSEVGSAYNAIDPNVFHDDATGKMWMTFGSFWNGIYITELDPNTGKPFSPTPAVTNIARNPVRPPNAIEAPYLYEHDGYYYLFVNWGNCCQGVDSTYEIRVGRSTSPTGPFMTRGRGPTMVNGGGEVFLGTEGNFIGPGHISIFSENGIDYFGYHYYDGNVNGVAKYNIEQLTWTMDGWPIPATDLIPGDFNGNGVVDNVDLGLWRTYYGAKADGQDFLNWQRNFGATFNNISTIAALPEPQALTLITFGVVASLSCRIRRALG